MRTLDRRSSNRETFRLVLVMLALFLAARTPKRSYLVYYS